MTSSTKQCSRCKVRQSLINFSKNRTKKDGLCTYCKPCAVEFSSNYYRNSSNKIKNYENEKTATLRFIMYMICNAVRHGNCDIPKDTRIKLAKHLYKTLLNNPYCPYTNEKLIPQVNLSLDHIKPVSKGGKTAIDNLEWVSKQANMVKSNLTPEEFYKFCQLVLDNRRSSSN